ncbi:hypothetical protein EMGBD1_20370 [Anaerolineaceae bacterium]|nr:hypothetical protein EMGBD1_20370 [Anaerolineaceae bacterium]
MVKDRGATADLKLFRKHDHTIGWCPDGSAGRRTKINATVKRAKRTAVIACGAVRIEW